MSSPELAEARSFERTLLALARASIEHGFRFGLPRRVEPSDFPPRLRELLASFVTLRAGDALRGCIGTLEAHRPLVADLAHNAFAAANRDPRFAPLRPEERDGIDLHLSILSAPEPIRFESERELLAALEPEVHGLSIRAGSRGALFLPQVWQELPDRREFLRRLRQKAGIEPGYPSEALAAARFTVVEIDGPLATNEAPVAAHG